MRCEVLLEVTNTRTSFFSRWGSRGLHADSPGGQRRGAHRFGRICAMDSHPAWAERYAECPALSTAPLSSTSLDPSQLGEHRRCAPRPTTARAQLSCLDILTGATKL